MSVCAGYLTVRAGHQVSSKKVFNCWSSVPLTANPRECVLFALCRVLSYQGDVNGELHSNAHGGDQDDHRDGAQLDANQAHDAKQFHRHHGQDKHLNTGDRDRGG